jgi:hypothetical protein
MRTARLTLAATVAYLVLRAAYPTARPLTGPLTALLVVQATLFATLTTGLRRVLSVVAGVLLAVVVSAEVGLTWWSLAAIIAASIAVGQLLRLGDHLLEVPISAMLVLGLWQPETAALSRVVETLVGAAVGVLVNVALPPTLRTRSAASTVERVSVEVCGALSRIAVELPHGVTAEQAYRWLEEFRSLGRFVNSADSALRAAAESRRLNPRAVGTLDNLPVLRSGLDALEHCTVGLRALLRSIADGVQSAEQPGSAAGERGPGGASAASTGDGLEAYDEGLRQAFAVLLHDLAQSVRSFGALVRAEAEGDSASQEEAAAHALEALRETRARLTELLLVDAEADTRLWELRGSMLMAVERVLRELDVEERGRRRSRWQEEALGNRRRSQVAAGRLRETSRSIVAQRRDAGVRPRSR